MRPHGSGERSGDERDGPGTDRGVEDQVDVRTARRCGRSCSTASAPVLGRRYLEDRLAFRLQELRYGGLSDRARRKLDALADQLEPEGGAPARSRAPDRRHAVAREWKGVEHVVTVREHDFEYDGRPYRSLSAIARAIAGSRWNGWAVLWPSSATGRPDERAAAQGPLRDLLPQELRGRAWTKRSIRWMRSVKPALPISAASATRAGSRVDDRYDDRRLLRRYPRSSGSATAAPRRRGRQHRHGRLLQDRPADPIAWRTSPSWSRSSIATRSHWSASPRASIRRRRSAD